jgi:hypothetical protein
MPFLVRYRCHRCGARRDGADGEAWVRCSFCGTLIGFDWQSWFESRSYAGFLASAGASMGGWAQYQSAIDEGERLASKNAAAAEARFREAAAKMLELLPHAHPPEAQTDAAYREKYLRYDGWCLLQMQVDEKTKSLGDSLQSVQRGMDFANPFPTLTTSLDLLRQQMERLGSLDGPEDPDGMLPPDRTRVAMAQFVTAYLHLLSAEQQLTLLRQIHGPEHVLVTGEMTDEVGLFIDWTCPRCGLVSFQGRTVTTLCCPGCYHQRPFDPGVLALDAITANCGGCGAEIRIDAEQLEVKCSFCGTVVRRLARTGNVERDFAKGVASALGSPPQPNGGVDGFPVNDDNRAQLVLAGFARLATWYAKLVRAKRYADNFRRTFPVLTESEQLRSLERVREIARRDGAGRDMEVYLDEVRGILDPNGGAG